MKPPRPFPLPEKKTLIELLKYNDLPQYTYVYELIWWLRIESQTTHE